MPTFIKPIFQPMSPMKSTLTRGWLPTVLFLAAPVFAADGLSPEELLERALLPPRVSYRARALTTVWNGGRGETEEVRVYRRPSGEERREFIGSDGKVVRVVVSDGQIEQVFVPGREMRLGGRASKATPKKLSAERERDLLLRNYRLSLAPEERVAGREGQAVVLIPVASGKPQQIYVVDKASGILLRVRRFLPGTNLAVQTVLLDLETAVPLADDLFEVSPEGGVKPHGLEPDFLPPEDAFWGPDNKASPPAMLPVGFVLESQDAFELSHQGVSVARYTDGLAVLSLYRTAFPSVLEDSSSPGGALRDVHWTEGGSHFTLVGDLSDQALQTISFQLQNSR